jgi:hypothetical protein
MADLTISTSSFYNSSIITELPTALLTSNEDNSTTPTSTCFLLSVDEFILGYISLTWTEHQNSSKNNNPSPCPSTIKASPSSSETTFPRPELHTKNSKKNTSPIPRSQNHQQRRTRGTRTLVNGPFNRNIKTSRLLKHCIKSTLLTPPSLPELELERAIGKGQGEGVENYPPTYHPLGVYLIPFQRSAQALDIEKC